MCELLLDDTFSLSNSRIKDANVVTLGSDSGLNLGNAEAVHQVVDSLLRNDQVVLTPDWAGREQTIPIRLKGPHSAARADMAVQVHLAVMEARKITLNPCDGWGAPAWWRVQWAEMNRDSDDYSARFRGEQRYDITLAVDAWAKSTELFTATALVAEDEATVLTTLNVPGSAPAAGDITAVHGGGGCLIYTAGVWNDHPDYDPLDPSAGDLPEGTYHLIVDMAGLGATAVEWDCAGQSGTTDLSTLGYDPLGLVCVANNIYISAFSGVVTPVISYVGGTNHTLKTMLLWVENPLTGKSASYTMTGPGVSSGDDFTVVAPTPERPIPGYTIGGEQDPTIMRAAGGAHHVDPGPRSKVFAAWAGDTAPDGSAVTWEGYPAFHTDVVPSSRW